MRILDLQRRLREIGRIRIGEQVPTSNGKTRPAKLTTFRFTSRDRTVIDAAAERFGGTVESWESPDGQQWQVKTGTDELSVVVPPGDMSFSQSYEQWTAGGCRVRCDSQWDTIADKACSCDPTARACDIHTRLSVLVADLPGIGVWRLDTQGYYAAVELGGVVDIAASFSERGQMLPARLRLEQRSVKRVVAGKPQTFRFVVPMLDLAMNPLALVQATGAQVGLEAGPSFTPVPVAALPDATQSVAAQLAAVDEPKTKRRSAAAPIPPTGLAPRTAAEAARPSEGKRGCTRCGQPLVGATVERDGAGYAHKGGCPTAGAEQAFPDVTAKQIGAAATKAFPLNDAPGGSKTATRDRLRYATAYMETGGRAWHLGDLSADELVGLHTRLGQIAAGQIEVDHDDICAVFTIGDKTATVQWTDIEPEASS